MCLGEGHIWRCFVKAQHSLDGTVLIDYFVANKSLMLLIFNSYFYLG